MSELEWKRPKPLEDDIAIKKIEEILGKEMPEDFKKCIIEFNKGKPNKKDFQTIDGEEHVFCNLISFKKEDDTNVFNCKLSN